MEDFEPPLELFVMVVMFVPLVADVSGNLKSFHDFFATEVPDEAQMQPVSPKDVWLAIKGGLLAS
jgi:hypothetical protein